MLPYQPRGAGDIVRSSRAFPIFLRGAGDDAHCSPAAVSYRELRRWFAFLVLLVVPISLGAQVTCASGAGPAMASPQSPGPVSSDIGDRALAP